MKPVIYKYFFFFCFLIFCFCSCSTPQGSPELPPAKKTEAEIQAKEKESLLAIGKALVKNDQEAIDIFMNLGLLEYLDTSYLSKDTKQQALLEYLPLSPDTKYHDFSAITSLLSDTYASEEVRTKFLQYPSFGNRLFENRGGITYMCPHYLENFTAVIALDSLSLQSYSATEATFAYTVTGSSQLTDGTLTIKKSSAGNTWRLDNSFYFSYLDLYNQSLGNFSAQWAESPLLDSRQNTGSMKALLGSVYIINVFLSDSESKWRIEETKKPLTMLLEALSYLENQAAAYGVPLTFETTDHTTSYYMQLPNSIPPSPEQIGWLGVYFDTTEYQGIDSFLSIASVGKTYDNVCILFHINKKGRSYSVPYDSEKADAYAFASERAVLFYSTEKTYPYYSTAATYAHEILHLAGAIDLYYQETDKDIRKNIIMNYFPFEIMLTVPDQIHTASISAFTAYRIGWRANLPTQLLPFQEESR